MQSVGVKNHGESAERLATSIPRIPLARVKPRETTKAAGVKRSRRKKACLWLLHDRPWEAKK